MRSGTPRGPFRQAAADLRRSRGQHLAIDQTDADLSGCTDEALRENLVHLRAPLTTALVDDAGRHRDQLQKREQELVDQRAVAEGQLRELEGPSRRWRRRRQPSQEAERARAALELWDRNLAEVRDQLQHLARTDDGSSSAAAAQGFETVAAEIDRRAQQRARAAEFDQPTYIASVLGRLPENPSGRDAWRSIVLEVERHRIALGVDHPHLPLGERPKEPALQRDHDRLAQRLYQTRTELLAELGSPPAGRDLPALEHVL